MTKKLILGTLGAAMLAVLSSSHADTPKGPAAIANAVPAALCGPGYTATNVSYRNGTPNSYLCSKTIPDQRVCNAGMPAPIGQNEVRMGNQLKLSYVCAFPVG